MDELTINEIAPTVQEVSAFGANNPDMMDGMIRDAQIAHSFDLNHKTGLAETVALDKETAQRNFAEVVREPSKGSGLAL